MTGFTARNLPYPSGTDKLADVDQQIQALATAVDSMVKVGVQATAAAIGASATGTQAVAFPVAFAAMPTVIAICNNSQIMCSVFGVTVNGFSVGYRNVTATATSGPVSFLYIAVGKVA